MSKLYKLYIDNEKKVPVAVSDDIWLLELFIVQRKLKSRNYFIDRTTISKETYFYNDNFIVYYYGYAISNYEYRYILDMTGEYQSDLELRIYELESSYRTHKNRMKKKEKKAFKETLKSLKRIDYSDNRKFAREMIDIVINRPGMIFERLDAMEAFKSYMEG